jgi:uncharacterized protein
LILADWRRWRDLPAYGRILLFIGILLIVWLPIAAPLYLTWGDKLGTALVILVYLEFIILIGIWGRKIEQKSQPYSYYGLVFSWRNLKELLVGAAIGIIGLLFLFGCQYLLGWQSLKADADWQGAILPAILTGLGVGFAEELLFRGWLLTELQKDYGFRRSCWYSSLIYALLHFNFIKPISLILATAPQFPGLVLLGINLATARQLGKGKLGLAIGLHGGMVGTYYVFSTTKLLQPSGVVPELITGIGGNPLAGICGLTFLGLQLISLILSFRLIGQSK